MKRCFTNARIAILCCLLVLSLMVSNPVGVRAQGDDAPSPTVLRVEEDWELSIGTPDSNSNGPQVTCVLSPSSNLYCSHALFELNHRTQPSASTGGMGLQVWHDEEHVKTCNPSGSQVASTCCEVVRWTQTMEIQNCQLVFSIINGQSTTWGTFGGGEGLRLSVTTHLSHLGGYSPEVSKEHSGVGFAGHCAESLVLKRVRLTFSDGNKATVELNTVVHSSDN